MSDKSPGENGKRVRLNPDERRQQLIDLGTEMLRERALEDISIGKIAEQAGISRGLLFHYFASKQDFQLAILRNASADLLAHTAPDTSLGLFDRLRDAVQRYIDYVSANRITYLAVLRGPTSTNPEMAALAEESRNTIVDRVLAAVPIPVDDPDQPRLRLAVRGWIAFVEETTLSWLREEIITRDQLIDMLVESLPALALSPALTAALRE
ncbi:TetR/AcrR family transcriptional regulator [Nocardia transvalensis]|uniref:TetR/AcrR family transcriptional regulator n=1 Tax=Nocardia transvalensis TaxID=37333 RepID=UPI001893D494|nr:TetR/AcrR family transcriptional regulator [Nocardia transvalensis]MBF6327272.1 TetR/AcrR family transcriptional regulator [Nocardia transvalensis]